MYGSLDVSTSGLVAQRTRLDVISANLANQDTILNADGEYAPYQRRAAILAAGGPDGQPGGVHVARITEDAAFVKRLQPDSPYADADGYVEYPDISPTVEMVNAMEATRSYEANIAAVEATKSMLSVALELLA